jgi:hypothetical protein
MTQTTAVFKRLHTDRTRATAVSAGMERPHDPAYNRDDETRPGRPPRPAQEPAGGKGSSRTSKTMTDPATGQPRRGPHRPNQSDADDTPRD